MTMGAKRGGKRKFSKDGQSAKTDLKRQCIAQTESERSAASQQSSAEGDPVQIDATSTCRADSVVATNADYDSNCCKGTAKVHSELPATVVNAVKKERGAYLEPTGGDEKSQEIPADTENVDDADKNANTHEETKENDRIVGKQTIDYVQPDQTGGGQHSSKTFGVPLRNDQCSVAESASQQQGPHQVKDGSQENNQAEVTSTAIPNLTAQSSPGRKGADDWKDKKEGSNNAHDMDLNVMESSKSCTLLINAEGVTIQADTMHEVKDKMATEPFRDNEFNRPRMDTTDPVLDPENVDKNGMGAAVTDTSKCQNNDELDAPQKNSNNTLNERSFPADPDVAQNDSGNPPTVNFTSSNVETTRQKDDEIKDPMSTVTVDRIDQSECALREEAQKGCPGETEEDTTFADGSVFEMDVTESQLCAVSDTLLGEQEKLAMDETAEIRRQRQEDGEKTVQALLGSLLKMNDLVIKTRREMETIRRRYQTPSGGIRHTKP